jgi:hypothetical protein
MKIIKALIGIILLGLLINTTLGAINIIEASIVIFVTFVVSLAYMIFTICTFDQPSYQKINMATGVVITLNNGFICLLGQLFFVELVSSLTIISIVNLLLAMGTYITQAEFLKLETRKEID